MARVIVCDVNETLLDVGALEPHFKQAFGDGRVLQDWFGTVLLYSEVATLAGPYSDFASIGGAALDMMAAARGVALSPTDRGRILQGMLTLPAHSDVRDGLQAMRDAGLRLVTLTNSAPAAVQQQLANAGLATFFEQSFSVDAVRRFKPAGEAYRSVAESLGLPPDRLRLVAAPVDPRPLHARRPHRIACSVAGPHAAIERWVNDAGPNAQCATTGSLTNNNTYYRYFKANHFKNISCNRFALSSFFCFNTWVSTRCIY